MEIHKICLDCRYNEVCDADLANGLRGNKCVDYWVEDFDGSIFYSQPKFTLGINTDGEINNYHFGIIQTLERFLIEEIRKERNNSNPIEYNGEGNA